MTFNLRHFPDRILGGHGIQAVHPDEFAGSLYDDNPDPFVGLVKFIVRR